MKEAIEFPSPVLAEGRNDYIDCTFDILCNSTTVRIEGDNLIVPISYSLTSDGLLELIENGDAAVIIILQSSAAFFRRIIEFPLGKNSMEIFIDKNQVIKNVEIIGSILATKDLAQFSLLEFNQEYFGGLKFSIRKGDILGQEVGHILDLNDSELEKPLTSIFNISEGENIAEKYLPNIDNDKIEIYLPKDAFEAYCKLKDLNNGGFRRYLTSIVILPALTEAIDRIIGNMQGEGEDIDPRLSELRWYRAIVKRSKELNVELCEYNSSTSALASKLLGDIVFDAMVNFKETCDDMMDGKSLTLGGVD